MQPSVNPTHQYQSSLASYCRSGSYEAIPGVRDRHVTQYRSLVYNIVDDILQSAFPLTYALMESVEWEELVHQFLAGHPCTSPQVWQMPKELYEFVEEKGSPLLTKYPFLLDLLYFEWLEVELFMMADISVPFSPHGNATTDALQLNPEHILQNFSYPVHLKAAKEIRPEDKGDYYLVLFRHPETGEVRFMDLSPALVYLIEQLAMASVDAQTLTEQVCRDLQIPFQQDTLQSLLPFINLALEKKLILGFSLKRIA